MAVPRVAAKVRPSGAHRRIPARFPDAHTVRGARAPVAVGGYRHGGMSPSAGRITVRG